MDIRHPSLSLYMLELLNEWSDCLQISREYDEDSGEFYGTLKAKFSQWLKDSKGEDHFISDAVVMAWRFGTREEADELIHLIKTVRDQIWPEEPKENAT